MQPSPLPTEPLSARRFSTSRIGAAYAVGGDAIGHTTAALKLVHEVQHEIGDVATLVQCGMRYTLAQEGIVLKGTTMSLCAFDCEMKGVMIFSFWVVSAAWVPLDPACQFRKRGFAVRGSETE